MSKKKYMKIDREWFEYFLDELQILKSTYIQNKNIVEALATSAAIVACEKIARHSSEISCKEFNNEIGQ